MKFCKSQEVFFLGSSKKKKKVVFLKKWYYRLTVAGQKNEDKYRFETKMSKDFDFSY